MSRQRLITLALMAIDTGIVALSPLLALLIRFEGELPLHYVMDYMRFLPFVLLIMIGVFYWFGLYRRLWRYASINELVAITGAVTSSSVLLAFVVYLIDPGFPRSVVVISWFVMILLTGASRMLVRVVSHIRNMPQSENLDNILIIGAGDAGAMIARELNHHFMEQKRLVGFIDDDPLKIGQMMYGVKVLGSRIDLLRVLTQYEIDEVIIAMPSVNGKTISGFVEVCKKYNCRLKILPGVYEIINGEARMSELRDVQLEDLLRREPVQLDMDKIASYLKGKRVLITGAGGSIGSELSRQIANIKPELLILLGRGENSIFEIHNELLDKFPDLHIEAVIADVRDKQRIEEIFALCQPQVVFHAAAHKHVPLMERSPQEAVKNNIFGTKNVAEAADRFGAETFILISTDKAVNPTSVMGATKRVAELILQNINRNSATCFAAVRFGNVLGSRGSVIPTFKRQIARGGPVTITHPDMKRYFMTIPEAVQLVLQAGSMACGGEVFVLDMGEPVKIVDMARDLIELSGLRPDKDIKIQYVGLRPGEKLFEELLTAEEGTRSTKHKKIYKANIRDVDEEKLNRGLLTLHNVVGAEETIYTLKKILPTYAQARLHYGRDKNNIEGEEHTSADICYYS